MSVLVGCAAERLEAVYGVEDCGSCTIPEADPVLVGALDGSESVRLSDYVCCPVISGSVIHVHGICGREPEVEKSVG